MTAVGPSTSFPALPTGPGFPRRPEDGETLDVGGRTPRRGRNPAPTGPPRHSPPGATRNVFPCRKPRGRVSLSNRNGGAPGRVWLKVAEQVAKLADEQKAIENKLATWH